MHQTQIMKPADIVPYILKKEKEGMYLYERRRPLREWNGGITLERAFEKTTRGCQSCAQEIKEVIIPLVQKQTNWGTKYNIPNDFVGPFVDPGALSLGIPECCIIPEVQKTHTLGEDGLDLIINTVVSSIVSTEVMRARGILACIIALIAERMDLSTRIVVGYTVMASKDTEPRSDYAIIVKDYGVPLDLPLLAFYCISPASSRLIGFSLFDANDSQSYHSNHWGCANTRYKVDRKKQIVIDHGYIRKAMTDPELAVEEAMTIMRDNGVIK